MLFALGLILGFIAGAALALTGASYVSDALDRLNAATDKLTAAATDAAAHLVAGTQPTDGATAAELDAVTAKIDSATTILSPSAPTDPSAASGVIS